MKNKCQLLIALFVVLSAVKLPAQNSNSTIEASWNGTLVVPGSKLAMVINISRPKGELLATMDVPAQMAKDLPASKTIFRNDSLLLAFKMMSAQYKGLFKADSGFISGSWEQSGYKFPLKLIRSARPVTVVKRSQDPVKPYPYNEEEVVFDNAKANIKLAGTFTWPKNKELCPVVVLISGSGPQNRDEELMNHRPFLVLADALAKKGIAVLRFDDRGVGQSTGDFATATSFDFSTDVEAAMAYLKTRKEIDKDKIGLIGHSEGGLIAPMIASRSKNVSFIVLLAGPGIKGDELLLLQNAALSKASGLDDEQIEKNKSMSRKVFAMAARNAPGTNDSIKQYLINLGMPESSAKAETQKVTSPWMKYFLASDPAVYLSKTNCPVLALNGKKDLQVRYKENLDAIETNLKKAKNKVYTIKAYDNLNHLFQHCTTGLPSEYGSIEETISPEVLNDIGDWILKVGKR